MHLTRYHGVFAPHSNYRAAVTPAQRGRGAAPAPVSGADAVKPSPPRHVAMSWARRLKRVFGVEIEGCVRCGGQLKIIASIGSRSSLRRYCRTWSVQRRSSIRASCRAGRGGRRCSPACCELEEE
jgi:hypothetical protein